MAKLRMTYKNLKALRKTREYQALLVDLVAINIVPKSAAENLLGYNIPANLIGGSESGSEEEPTVTEPEETGITVTLLYFDAIANDGAGGWQTAELALETNVLADETTGIIAAAKTAFTNDTIDSIDVVVENTNYVEGTSGISEKYTEANPQPSELTEGALIVCFKKVSFNPGQETLNP